MKKHIPNALTMANLFCGCCALVAILTGNSLKTAAIFTLFSLILDWLDGTAARLLKVEGPLGKELDSLADVVSFGVVPGAIFFRMLGMHETFEGQFGVGQSIHFLPFFVFVLSAFSAFRLAKFNLDTRQTNHFLGLATPACTIFVVGLGLAWENDQFGLQAFLSSPFFIFSTIAVLCFLLVSEIPMFAFKLKNEKKASSISIIIAVILVSTFLLSYLKGIGLSLLMVIYIITSMLFFRPKK